MFGKGIFIGSTRIQPILFLNLSKIFLVLMSLYGMNFKLLIYRIYLKK